MINIESLDKENDFRYGSGLCCLIQIKSLGFPPHNQIGASWYHSWLEVLGASLPTNYVTIRILICFGELTAAYTM